MTSYKYCINWSWHISLVRLHSQKVIGDWFVVMKIQSVLENNTEPITCSKSSGTGLESIVIPSENFKVQGKSRVTTFLIMR